MTPVFCRLEPIAPLLEQSGFEVVRWPRDEAEQAAFLAEVAPTLEAAVTTGPLGLPEAFLQAAAGLKLIALVGAGYEAFDPAALAARGVRLTNGGQLNAEDVAELAMGLYIALQRGVVAADRWVREARWPTGPFRSRRVMGRRCGVVGLGAIGAGIARRAAAFGMEVAWTGPRPKPEAALRYEPDPMALAAWSDALFLACPLTPQTLGLVDAALLGALGPEGFLINVARGAVVDEPALIAALKEGRIAGAGLDVFAEEPDDGRKWADLPNVLLHPHAAGATFEALEDVRGVVVENLRRHFAGAPLRFPVN